MSHPGPSKSAGRGEIPSPFAGRRPAPFWLRLWAGWKRVAEAIGNFNARVLLTVFYLIFVAPLACGVKLFLDPLGLRRSSGSYWTPVARRDDDLAAAKRQFS